jgi:hypothetical protein
MPYSTKKLVSFLWLQSYKLKLTVLGNKANDVIQSCAFRKKMSNDT